MKKSIPSVDFGKIVCGWSWGCAEGAFFLSEEFIAGRQALEGNRKTLVSGESSVKIYAPIFRSIYLIWEYRYIAYS